MTFAVRPWLRERTPKVALCTPDDWRYLMSLDEAASLTAQLRLGIQHAMKLNEMLADPLAARLLLIDPNGHA